MSPEQIISSITQGQMDPKWMVFRYNKTRSFLMLLYKIFFAGLFLGSAGILFFSSKGPLSSDLKVTVYGLGGVGFIGLLVLLHHIYTLFFLQKNMIVLTESDVIKSIRGKILNWPYTNITNLRQIVTQGNKSTYPTYSVEFTDSRNNHIHELARGREFGPSQDIFEVLRTKVQ